MICCLYVIWAKFQCWMRDFQASFERAKNWVKELQAQGNISYYLFLDFFGLVNIFCVPWDLILEHPTNPTSLSPLELGASTSWNLDFYSLLLLTSIKWQFLVLLVKRLLTQILESDVEMEFIGCESWSCFLNDLMLNPWVNFRKQKDPNYMDTLKVGFGICLNRIFSHIELSCNILFSMEGWINIEQ